MPAFYAIAQDTGVAAEAAEARRGARAGRPDDDHFRAAVVGIADAGDGRRPVIVDTRRRRQWAIATARAGRGLFQRTQAEPFGLNN